MFKLLNQILGAFAKHTSFFVIQGTNKWHCLWLAWILMIGPILNLVLIQIYEVKLHCLLLAH